MTDLIAPRPIALLTEKMGMVLLIGNSGYTTTPTRAETGYRDDKGALRTYDGETFTSGGEAATSFIPIPYDERIATKLASGKPVPQYGEIEDAVTLLHGIAWELAEAIGARRALAQMTLSLATLEDIDPERSIGEDLIFTIDQMLIDYGINSADPVSALADIRKAINASRLVKR